MTTKAVRFTCQTGYALPLSELKELQGDLKTMSEMSLQKLCTEIDTTGFSFAPHVWKSPSGAHYIIDGHQRTRALRHLVDHGWTADDIPVVLVEAESIDEAKERVLQGVSQYGEVSSHGMLDFLGSFENEMTFDDVALRFEIPDINMNSLSKLTEDLSLEAKDDAPVPEAAASRVVHTCPKCNFSFMSDGKGS